MFSLKSPSLLAFEEQTKVERRNLHSIYHIGAIPSDTQMREALDPIDPAPLGKLFSTLFATLEMTGVIEEYHFWRDFVAAPVDGVEHFSSTKIHCANCTTRHFLRDLTFKLTEKFNLQFRAEAFNLSNTPHFANPNGNANSSNFGKILATQAADAVGRSREFRFGLRLGF
jgi:hypothetical protein